MKKNIKYNHEHHEPLELVLKLGFFGEKMTGKTSIIKRYFSDRFIGRYSPSQSPVLMEKQLNVGKIAISLKIWDTYGFSCFSTKISQYIDGLDGIFLVYDITNAESFHNLKKWIKEIKKDSSEFTLMLIGNKSDLLDKRAISFKEGKEFAEAQSMHFFETSALSPKNIEECFNYIINERLMKYGITINPNDFSNNKESNKKCLIY